MDIIALQSFFPEIFLSITILLQLVYNIYFVKTISFNYPVLDFEVVTQTFFILCCAFFLFFNLKIEGYFLNFLFVNNNGWKNL